MQSKKGGRISDYLCDSHVCVIHGNCQLIRNHVVAALNKKITARTGKIFSVGSIYQVGEGNKDAGLSEGGTLRRVAAAL